MFVASPRTLLALGKYSAIPLASHFAHINKRNEPTAAILFTACLSLLAIVFGTLNKIAGLLTMFFLITYGMLNISVFIEQIMGIASFRPAFKVHIIFPLLGGVGCLFAMFLINPLFSLVAILIIILIYLILIQQEVRENWPDVRKGLFIFIAEQAMKISRGLPYHPKIWKPNLLIPVSEPKEWSDMTEFIRAITFPSGRVTFFKVAAQAGYSQTHIDKRKQIDEDFSLLTTPLKEGGILAGSVVVGSADFLQGATIVTQTLEASVFPPNIFLVKLGLTPQQDPELKKLIERMESLDLGVLLLALHPTKEFGLKQMINVWLREKSPNVDLAILIALKIQKNWDAKIRLIQAVDSDNDKTKAWSYLYRIKKTMRIPKDTETLVVVGNFEEVIASAPGADINMFGMPEEVNIAEKRKIADKIDTSILFFRDSKHESAVA
jgi:solute carrier family 12 sodium/potassium/chloride transporter 2